MQRLRLDAHGRAGELLDPRDLQGFRDEERLAVVESDRPEQHAALLARHAPRQPPRHHVDLAHAEEREDRCHLDEANLLGIAEDRGRDRAADVDVEAGVTPAAVDE